MRQKVAFRSAQQSHNLTRIGPSLDGEFIIRYQKHAGIACDLFVRSNPGSDFIRLRIPNVYSSSIVDPASTGEWMEKLLPSSTQWIIFEDKGRDDESAIDQSDGLANLREVPPEVLINGIRGEEQGGVEGGEERGEGGVGGGGGGGGEGGEGGDAAAKSPYNKYLLRFRLRSPGTFVDPDTNTV